MKFGVVVFPGSNCDRDVVWVTLGLLGQPTRMIWHQDTDLSDIDVVVIPGGFSYGDYLRCGAIARFSPVMRATVEHANRGKFVLGICNGFQVLTELGLLPGALVKNRDLHFICDRVPLTVVNHKTPWTVAYSENEVIDLPIAHGEGCYYADEKILAELEGNNQVVFRYGSSPTPNPEENCNGSLNNIAGICNAKGNVLGMMPHPERASDPSLGQTEGIKLFEGLLLETAKVG